MVATEPSAGLPMAILRSVTGLDELAKICLTMYGYAIVQYVSNQPWRVSDTHNERSSIALTH